MASLNFDLSQTGTFDSFSPLDPGDYVVRVVDSSITENFSGESRLTLVYAVEPGQNGAGRQVYDNLSFWSSNPSAVDMAKKKLKSIAIACGHKNPNYVGDSSELHGKLMKVRLAIREGGNGKLYQDVKGYEPAAQKAPAHGRPAPAPQPAASPKPWE